MEREFSVAWQSVMDGALTEYLKKAEADICQAVGTFVSQTLVDAFGQIGMEASRLVSMTRAGESTTLTSIRHAFRVMRQDAKMSQRSLNRSLLPKVTQCMWSGYSKAFAVERGTGTFGRMKDALEKHAADASQNMFEEAAASALDAVFDLVSRLSKSIFELGTRIIPKQLHSVYSVCWDEQAFVGPAERERIQSLRFDLLVNLKCLRMEQDKAMKMIGILERDVLLSSADSEEKKTEKTTQSHFGGHSSEYDENGRARMPPTASSPEEVISFGTAFERGFINEAPPVAVSAATLPQNPFVQQREPAPLDVPSSHYYL